MSEWTVYCKHNTFTPKGVLKRLFKGNNIIAHRADALSLLRNPGLCVVDPQSAVDCGIVTAKEVAALGYDVIDKATAEPVMAKDHFKMTNAMSDPVDKPEVDPEFSKMTRGELRAWADRLSDLGHDSKIRSRDSHDDLAEKLTEAYDAAAIAGDVLSAKNPKE